MDIKAIVGGAHDQDLGQGLAPQPTHSALRTLSSGGLGAWGPMWHGKKSLPSSTELTPHPLFQNASWFCLAWCTFFLVPSIIFAIKTSKYFHPIWKRLR